MHEYSIVRSLIHQAEAIVASEGGKATEIHVSIGPLSGVEPLLVESAYEQLAADSKLSDAVLRIEETELQARCCDCNGEFVIRSFVFECPHCDSRHVDVTGGDDFRLVSITVEEMEERGALHPR